MKAISKSRPAAGLELVDVPVPTPGINDVLIKIKKTAICGTDIHIYNWDHWAEQTIKPPMIIGHEFVGEIASVGSNVKGFKPGDLVDGWRGAYGSQWQEIAYQFGTNVFDYATRMFTRRLRAHTPAP